MRGGSLQHQKRENYCIKGGKFNLPQRNPGKMKSPSETTTRRKRGAPRCERAGDGKLDWRIERAPFSPGNLPGMKTIARSLLISLPTRRGQDPREPGNWTIARTAAASRQRLNYVDVSAREDRRRAKNFSMIETSFLGY